MLTCRVSYNVLNAATVMVRGEKTRPEAKLGTGEEDEEAADLVWGGGRTMPQAELGRNWHGERAGSTP